MGIKRNYDHLFNDDCIVDSNGLLIKTGCDIATYSQEEIELSWNSGEDILPSNYDSENDGWEFMKNYPYVDYRMFADTHRGYLFERVYSLYSNLYRAGYVIDDKGIVYDRYGIKVAIYAHKRNLWNRVACISYDDLDEIREKDKVDFPEPDDAIYVFKNQTLYINEYKSMEKGNHCSVSVHKCPYYVWRFKQIFSSNPPLSESITDKKCTVNRIDYKLVLSYRFTNCTNYNSVSQFLKLRGCDISVGNSIPLKTFGL